MDRLAALLCIAFLPLAAWAQDPPGRVARLSLAEGEVAVFTDAEQGWEGARVNSHLTGENSVWTEPRARAEVRFGAKALRLGEATQLDIVRLDDEVFQAHVPRGSLSVRIGDLGAAEAFVVTTPEARFQLRGNGRYRVDADPARGESRLAVLEGNARFEVAGGYVSIDTGRGVRVSGGERPRFEFEPAGTTALDDWAAARDRRWEEREAARYVPREMTGWEDLDDYGVWRNEPEYGAVWFPTVVDAGWAPYRYGRWTWVRPWGWAWVDDAPWGYAPFHYGRWVFVGGRWGWYPGRYTARPVWAPALVGWVGGPGWSLSVSSGPVGVVGWYPLSPYEAYVPWYTVNTVYVTRVNHIVLPHRRDRDGRHDGRPGDRPRDRYDERHPNRIPGATVVPRDQFGTRRPVQSVFTPVSREVVAAQPVASSAPALPSRAEWRQRTRPGENSTSAPWAPSSDAPAARPYPSSPLTPGKPPIAGAPAAQPRPAAPSVTAPRYDKPVTPQPAPSAMPHREKPVPVQPVPADRFPREKPVAVPSVGSPAPTVQSPVPAPRPNALSRPAPVQPAPAAKPPEIRVPQAPARVAPAPQPERAAPAPKPEVKPSATVAEKPQAGGKPAGPPAGDKPGKD